MKSITDIIVRNDHFGDVNQRKGLICQTQFEPMISIRNRERNNTNRTYHSASIFMVQLCGLVPGMRLHWVLIHLVH
jgi:hypothetical protein